MDPWQRPKFPNPIGCTLIMSVLAAIRQWIACIQQREIGGHWKIAAPLQKLVSVGPMLVARGRRWRHDVSIGAEILSREGPLRLLQRIRHKLRSPYRYAVAGPVRYGVSACWRPLAFPKHESPLVSIVIPVHNKHLYTFTCLQSLHETVALASCEIIVVDDGSDDETPRMLEAMQGVRVVRNTGERGFIHACNLGASMAGGRYLVFLNNDTIALPGWLEALLEVFNRYPDAGLVGACLLYPDGRLQEAGVLGVDTRGNFADGPLQDVHWPESLFGYFPCYTLGAMYAAQWFAAMRRATPDLDERIARGDLDVVFDWLGANIWSQGSRWSTDELALRASGEVLNPAHFKAHLQARYLG